MNTRTRQPLPVIGPRNDAPRQIALVAHDNKKQDLLDWARFNRDILADHRLFGTGTTGGLIRDALDLPVMLFRSGPLGGPTTGAGRGSDRFSWTAALVLEMLVGQAGVVTPFGDF